MEIVQTLKTHHGVINAGLGFEFNAKTYWLQPHQSLVIIQNEPPKPEAPKLQEYKVKKATDWFPIEVNPVYVGVYQISGKCKEDGRSVTALGHHYSYWNGLYWCSSDYSPESAIRHNSIPSSGVKEGYYVYWRGLLQ